MFVIIIIIKNVCVRIVFKFVYKFVYQFVYLVSFWDFLKQYSIVKPFGYKYYLVDIFFFYIDNWSANVSYRLFSNEYKFTPENTVLYDLVDII